MTDLNLDEQLMILIMEMATDASVRSQMMFYYSLVLLLDNDNDQAEMMRETATFALDKLKIGEHPDKLNRIKAIEELQTITNQLINDIEETGYDL